MTSKFIINLPINIKDINKYNKTLLYDRLISYQQVIKDIEPVPFNEPLKNNSDNEDFEPFENQNDTDNFILEPEKKNLKKNYTLSINNNSINITQLEKPKTCQSICCWWCCYEFDNDPIYIPKNFKNNNFEVFGHFCSFNCAMSYNYNNEKNWIEQKTLLYLLFKKTNNIFLDQDIKISYAPRREVLEKFGGSVSIDDYRQNFNLKSYNLEYPPFTLIIPELEEIQYTKDISIKTSNIPAKEEQQVEKKLVLERKTKKTKNILDIFGK